MNYLDMDIKIFRRPLVPMQIIGTALNLTQTGQIEPTMCSKRLLQFVIRAEHTSVLEHVVYTFAIENVSRAFLAQVTRHRMASPTSASQHYTDYSDMPFVHELPFGDKIFDSCRETYAKLLGEGVKKEEARMVLPNASVVNLLLTINLRSILNLIRVRACKRNVKEMRLFAERLAYLVYDDIPELKRVLGPPCAVDGRCNQGHMSCHEPYKYGEFISALQKRWGI